MVLEEIYALGQYKILYIPLFDGFYTIIASVFLKYIITKFSSRLIKYFIKFYLKCSKFKKILTFVNYEVCYIFKLFRSKNKLRDKYNQFKSFRKK